MASDVIEESAKLIANCDDLRTAIQMIRDEEVFVVHMTGQHLGRHGSIDVLIVSTLNKGVFMFDITTLGNDVFEAGMREILEWQRWVKLMYDCKRASDALYHLYDVKLSNVMDVQLLEIMNYEKIVASGETSRSMVSKTLRSLKMSCEKYLKGSPLLDRINELPQPPLHYKGVLIVALYDTLKKDQDLTMIREASERYADYFRSYTIMPEKKYYDHQFLPHNILVYDLQTPCRQLVCSGCKRNFLAKEFGEDHVVSETKRKCRVCKLIDIKNPDVFWVDSTFNVTTVIEKLYKKHMISAVFQRHGLARSKALDVIFIGTEECEVYVFDITVLGDQAFELGLRELLENNEVKKLVFNCPDTSDTLNVMHGVYLQNFFDIQILEVMHRKSLAKNDENYMSIVRAKGFKSCIERYIGTKKKKSSPYTSNLNESLDNNYGGIGNVWTERPIREEILKAWVAGTLNIFSLFDALKEGKDLEFLASASERYANHMRSYEKLPISKYVHHPYLPSDVLAHNYTSYEVNQLCGCCKKMLPSEDFGLQQESGRLKCKICRIVDQDEPDVIWVDNESILIDAMNELMEEKTLSVICQKRTQQVRSEPLDIIFVGTDDSKVYLFDVKVLGETMFAAGLRDILEGSKCVKLMFDCKDSSDTLHKLHNVWLAGVLDIQVLEVIYRKKSDYKTIGEAASLNGLVRSIHIYVKKGCYTVKPDAQAFGNEELRIQTAKANWKAALTANLFALFYKLKLEINKDLLFEASQRYVDYLRSYENLPHKKYIHHKFLPMNILNDAMDAKGDNKQTCGGCEKQFISEELRQGRAKDGMKMCGVCLEVDKGEPNIIWLDDIVDVADAAKDLQGEQFVSIVCQRHNLARSGPMDVIFVGTEDCTVYVFDITTLGKAAFDNGLRSVLEGQTPVKLMFDCRDESDTLHKMHDTWLAHVVDVQLINVLEWRVNPRNKYRHRDINSVHRLKGWKACTNRIPKHSLKCSPNFYSMGNTRDGGRNVWAQRPLENRLVIYWAAGTLNMFTLYEAFKSGLDMEMVSRASARYVNYFRSYEDLPLDTKYIFHSYLPHNILTEAASLDVRCTGCRKEFAQDEFNVSSIRGEIQKCRVCRNVDRDEYCKAKDGRKAGTASHT